MEYLACNVGFDHRCSAAIYKLRHVVVVHPLFSDFLRVVRSKGSEGAKLRSDPPCPGAAAVPHCYVICSTSGGDSCSWFGAGGDSGYIGHGLADDKLVDVLRGGCEQDLRYRWLVGGGGVGELVACHGGLLSCCQGLRDGERLYQAHARTGSEDERRRQSATFSLRTQPCRMVPGSGRTCMWPRIRLVTSADGVVAMP